VGLGYMGIEYTKVLKDLDLNFVPIGRGEESAAKYKEETGIEPITGGLKPFIETNPDKPDYAIVATGVEMLKENTLDLINYGIKNILLEKPGGKNIQEIKEINAQAKSNKANVYLAYNRRFYAGVLKAKELIEKDGGVSSFNFEFTEWSHKIAPLVKGEGVKEKWFLANSTHVVDLAFFLGGWPKEINCYYQGGLSWHTASSVFSGAGVSDKEALFSYHADWEAPGRWGVEILTKKHKYIFCPIEKLQVQEVGSIKVDFADIDYTLDEKYKPGLFVQVSSFLGDCEGLCDINNHVEHTKIYYEMAGY